MIRIILSFILLLHAERQFFDEGIPGLRYEDPPDMRNEGLQFLDDENPAGVIHYPEDPVEEESAGCEF